jgi:hypothetical protein
LTFARRRQKRTVTIWRPKSLNPVQLQIFRRVDQSSIAPEFARERRIAALPYRWRTHENGLAKAKTAPPLLSGPQVACVRIGNAQSQWDRMEEADIRKGLTGDEGNTADGTPAGIRAE